MQQQQVEVVGAQRAQRLLRGGNEVVRLELAGEDLRGEEDLGAIHAARGDPRTHLLLVLVGARGVDLPVADLERVAHGLLGVAAGDLPGAEAQPRDARPLDLDRLSRLIRCGHAPSRTRPARLTSRLGALLIFASSRAISSAGRAPPRQGGGHWFEPSIAHLREPLDARARGVPRWPSVGPNEGANRPDGPNPTGAVHMQHRLHSPGKPDERVREQKSQARLRTPSVAPAPGSLPARPPWDLRSVRYL